MLRQLFSFFLVCTLALTSRAQDAQTSADLTTAILIGYAGGSLTTDGGSVMFSGDPIGSDGILSLENSIALEDWFAMMDTLTSYDGDTTVFIGTLGDGTWLEEMINLSGTDGWVYLEPTEYTTITLIPSERLAYAPSSEPAAPATTTYLPADNNPPDGVISAEEFDTYCQAWRSGVNWPEHGGPIPIDFLTRTAKIFWKFDGAYTYEEGSDPSDPGSYYGSDWQLTDSNWENVNFTPVGGTMVEWSAARVVCELRQLPIFTAYAVELTLPQGWHSLPVDKGGIDMFSVDALETGTLDAAGRTLRWGPYHGSDIPANIGTALISMEGKILPEVSTLAGAMSRDGSSTSLTYEMSEPSLYVYLSRDDEEGRDPGLRPAGPLLERALAGTAKLPKKNFSPAFERFTDDEGQARIHCTLVRDVIYPEMGFQVQRTTNFTNWETLPVEWTLTNQNGRMLTFETTVACLDNGQPETYRVLVTEDNAAASGLARIFEGDTDDEDAGNGSSGESPDDPSGGGSTPPPDGGGPILHPISGAGGD